MFGVSSLNYISVINKADGVSLPGDSKIQQLVADKDYEMFGAMKVVDDLQRVRPRPEGIVPSGKSI